MVRGKLMETLFPNFALTEQKPTSESWVKLSQALQSLGVNTSPTTFVSQITQDQRIRFCQN